MASIDKIYGTLAQQQELTAWLSAHLLSAMRYLYSWYPEFFTDGKEHTISCFPEDVDRLLRQHCPLPWVQQRLAEQYGADWLRTDTPTR